MKKFILCASVLLASTASFAFAEEEVNYNETTLTGDWGGFRSTLADAGVTAEITYKADVMANIAGGTKKSVRGLDNLDIVFNFDGEKLLGSTGTTAMIHLLNNNGGQPDGSLVGSGQGINNIEVAEPTAKLYQAWIQQNFMGDKLSVLAGLYDLNSEFYVTDSSGLFLHSTYGIGSEVAQSGKNGPSIFPFTSLGARVAITPNDNFYAQAVVLDAVSGDPENPKGTQLDFEFNDGALVVGEIGFIPNANKPSGKIAVGAWYYSSEFDDSVDKDGSGNATQRNNKGAYIIGEHQLYSEQGAEDQGLSAFGRFGFADEDVNQFDYAWSAGVVYTGLVEGRDEGQLGFAVAGANNSDKYITSQTSSTDSSETAIELTYGDNLTPWLAVQPNVQYVINPGTDPNKDNALILGSRFTLQF